MRKRKEISLIIIFLGIVDWGFCCWMKQVLVVMFMMTQLMKYIQIVSEEGVGGEP